MSIDSLTEAEFLNRFLLNAPQFMWFLGAGSSRSANMPTATDLLWDLKAKYYCRTENEVLANHDIDKRAIRTKIQNYFDSKGCPAPFTPEEYGFYFDLTFSGDDALQQQYLAERLSVDNIALNIGQRALAALIEAKLIRVIFTTNFDDVLETAYAHVAGKSLSAFSLDGSYGALDALNAERFPLYAKIHGDFRYRNIKNLPKDLLENDRKIQECFLAASNRFGLVVNGYSGRDSNVMQMLERAIKQPNAFPQGLIWTTSKHGELAPSVLALLESAKAAGVKAFLYEADTFDTLTARIWRQAPNPDPILTQRVFSGRAQSVRIPLQLPGKKYPILRTNALPIISVTSTCGRLATTTPINFGIINDKRKEIKDTALTFTGEILFWGSIKDAQSAFSEYGPLQISDHVFPDPVEAISESTILRGFFEEALANALCSRNFLKLRRSKQRTWYAVVSHSAANDPRLNRLRTAAGIRRKAGAIHGIVPGLKDTHWAEAVSIKLEEKEGHLWLLLRPDVWISPMSEREHAIQFLRNRKVFRWNAQSYELLDAWIELLLGSIGGEREISVSAFSGGDHSPTFRIGTRTGFSLRT